MDGVSFDLWCTGIAGNKAKDGKEGKGSRRQRGPSAGHMQLAYELQCSMTKAHGIGDSSAAENYDAYGALLLIPLPSSSKRHPPPFSSCAVQRMSVLKLVALKWRTPLPLQRLRVPSHVHRRGRPQLLRLSCRPLWLRHLQSSPLALFLVFPTLRQRARRMCCGCGLPHRARQLQSRRQQWWRRSQPKKTETRKRRSEEAKRRRQQQQRQQQ